MRRLIAAALLMGAALTAAAADICHDKASLYQLALSLRDQPLHTAMMYTGSFAMFSPDERAIAVTRVRSGGDLEYLSAATIYKHIYLECKGAK